MTASRSLLERAAKAAGIAVSSLAPLYMCKPGTDLALIVKNERGGESVWNPLESDGDALRLAVKLQGHGFSMLDVAWPIIEAGKSGKDIYAAARLAIVTAAASLAQD
jgi:hypothetical protein